MNIDQGRKQKIPGYTHPDSINPSRDIQYKTFSEGKKKHMVGVTSGETKYAKSGLENPDETCPVCNKIPTSVCHCLYNDKRCSDNHVWYTDRSGKSVSGDPH
jgi:hypothetical protein